MLRTYSAVAYLFFIAGRSSAHRGTRLGKASSRFVSQSRQRRAGSRFGAERNSHRIRSTDVARPFFGHGWRRFLSLAGRQRQKNLKMPTRYSTLR